jgi:pyruvate formate lyase activating enzyme
MRREAILYERLSNQTVQCHLCSHYCKISSSGFGICGVRQNIDGKLYTLVYGLPVALGVDPIEKKPLYHFLPGSFSYSIATVGCNFKCGFCQNWQISQVSKKESFLRERRLNPEEVVRQAKEKRCLSISYTYTEPTIFFEYALDIAKLAKEEGLYNVFVTNGYMSRQALEVIKPYLDAANIDLKSFSEEYYKNNCKAHLKPVLDTIVYMKKLNIWIEVTTLIIPGENDSEEELAGIAEFIAHIGKDVPWHISRFHPDYKFTDYTPTPLETLRKAKEIGKAYGLRYIYLGNVAEGQDTYCYKCGELLIRRNYFYVEDYKIINNCCSKCGTKIEGIWK